MQGPILHVITGDGRRGFGSTPHARSTWLLAHALHHAVFKPTCKVATCKDNSNRRQHSKLSQVEPNLPNLKCLARMASPGAAADQTGAVQTGQQHVDQQHASQPHQPQQQQQQHEADPRQQQADHPQQQQQQHAGDPQQQRRDYAMHMRRLFSPPGMLHPDGSINQEFFRPKKVVTLTDK